MLGYIIITVVTLFAFFVFLLVLGKTFNNIVNQLTKLEYMLRKETELRKETIEIRRLLREESERAAMAAAQLEEAQNNPPPPMKKH